ncbi:MAG: tetratricopeptide repeat protein, partial [Planctomycetota bacterium]
LAPDMAAAHFYAGHGYLQSERFDDAQREFTRALELEPEDPAVLIGLAKVSLSKREPKVAIGFLERAIAKTPSTREAYWLMASAWRDGGDEAKAAEYSKPGEPPPQQEAFADKLRSQQLGNEGVTLRFARMRADVLLARDQSEEALAELTRYLDQVPKSAAALGALGDLYMKLDRPMDAIPRYQAALSIDPALAQAHSMWGTALYRTGKTEEGIEKTREAVALEPLELDFKSNLASMLAAQGTKPALDEALALMNEVAKGRPQDPRAWINLAQVLGASTKADEAIAAFQKAVDLAPNDSGVRHEFGVLCARVGRIPEAAEAFAAVVKADPARMEARTNLIHALTMLGRDSDAIAALRNALEIAPKNPQFRAQLAWLLATSKDDAARSGTEALGIAHELVEASQGKNPEFLVIQAAAEAESGDFPSAILSIDAGLELLKPKPGGDGSVVQDPMQVGIIDRALACRKVFQEGRPYRVEAP